MKKVLIVEDDLIISEDIKIKLERQELSVCGQAMSYNEAVKCYEEEGPDLVFIDIQLKGNETGIDLGNFIKKHRRSVPFIFLTSNSDAATRERAVQTQPSGFVNKPFVEEDLIEAICQFQ